MSRLKAREKIYEILSNLVLILQSLTDMLSQPFCLVKCKKMVLLLLLIKCTMPVKDIGILFRQHYCTERAIQDIITRN